MTSKIIVNWRNLVEVLEQSGEFETHCQLLHFTHISTICWWHVNWYVSYVHISLVNLSLSVYLISIYLSQSPILLLSLLTIWCFSRINDVLIKKPNRYYLFLPLREIFFCFLSFFLRVKKKLFWQMEALLHTWYVF